MGRSIWISTSAVALLWCGASPALAQDGPEATQLDEIVITAERRTTSLQDAPIAADVLTGDQLVDRGVTTIESLQFATPSLTVQNSGQGNSFNIRGIGKTENSSSIGVGVITYRDGVAAFPAYFQNEPFYDISAVEVLRGPQGTFAGQNATGGAVFVSSRRPDVSGFNGYGQVHYGNYNDVGVQGAINIPVSDTVAVRLALNTRVRDSFFDVIAGAPTGSADPGALSTRSLRASLLWEPTDALSILWTNDYNHIDMGGYPTSPWASTDDLFDIRTNGPSLGRDETFRSVLNIGYEFDNGITFRSITGYQFGNTQFAGDSDGTNVLPFSAAYDVNQTLWSQEFNLVSPEDQRLRWVAGAYYQSDLIDFPAGRFVTRSYLLPLPILIDVYLEGRNPKTSAAVFGQISYDLTDRLELQVGGRYSQQTVVNDALSSAPMLGLYLSQDDRYEDDVLTGKIALNWRLDDDNLFYAFIARGYKSGGINGVNVYAIPPGPFEAEEVTDLEVGWKADWFDGQLRTQIGGYYNQYENFQIILGDPVFPVINSIVNVTGQTPIYGLEATAQGRFGDLGFDVGLTLAHSELPDYFAADSRVARTGACDPDMGPASGNCVNVAGNAQTYAPEMTFRLGVQYDIPLADGVLTPRVDYSHISETWTTIFANEALGDRLQARDIVNAQLTYAINDWSIQAYSTNLLDEHYIASIKGGQRYAAPPRQFGIRVRRDF
jgi:iron complex outermembrane receptor protein